MFTLALTTLVVDNYDEAIAFYVDTLGFALIEDTDLGGGKRWVVVRPGPNGGALLLAQASTDAQRAVIGAQTGGRVGFFLHTDDIDATVNAWSAKGVQFLETPRREDYGTVVVFVDLYGNKWDLIEPASPESAGPIAVG